MSNNDDTFGLESIPDAEVVINLDMKITDVGLWVVSYGNKVELLTNYIPTHDWNNFDLKNRCVYEDCNYFVIRSWDFKGFAVVASHKKPDSSQVKYSLKRGKDYYLGMSHRSSVLYLSLIHI